MRANDPKRMPSSPNQRFATVPRADIPRSVFDLSHSVKGTFTEAGLLVPFDLYEVYPGDTFKINPVIFCRLTTQLVPIMDNMYIDDFWFFVPCRLVWDNWAKFMGEQANPADSIDFTIPQLVSGVGGFTRGTTTADSLGVPCGVPGGGTYSVNALPFRAYNLIYNEWFRDQNLINSLVVDRDNGPDLYTDYTAIRRRAKKPDYFTTCLPWPQKGGVAVSLPLGVSAPVLGIGKVDSTFGVAGATYRESDGTTSVYTNSAPIGSIASEQFAVEEGITGTGGTNDFPWVRADLSSATAATINQLRQAFQIQRMLERDARGGTRYIEMIHAHFGVVNPDFRLQRPEFLGGRSVPFFQQTVAQTTFQGTETRLDAKGSLSANSAFLSQGSGFVKSFTEHGYIIGIVNVRADVTYQQGISRVFTRSTRYDFYFPAFAHLGEQAVQSREIYSNGLGSPTAVPPTEDYSIFGYQERFSELRYQRNRIFGYLQSDVSGTLDYWHLAQDFASRPTLSQTFIEDDPPIERITAIAPSSSSPAFMFDAYMSVRAVRALPSYSVPGLIDHF